MVSKSILKSSRTTLTKTGKTRHKKRINTYCANKNEKKCKKMKRTHKCRWVKDINQNRNYCRKQSNITAATPFKKRKSVKRKSVKRKSVKRKTARSKSARSKSARNKSASVRIKIKTASVKRRRKSVKKKKSKRAKIKKKTKKNKNKKKKKKKVRFKKIKTASYPWKLRKNGKTVFKFKTV